MPKTEQIRQAVAQADVRPDTFTKRDFTLSAGAPNSREKVATVQVNRPHAVMSGRPVDLALMAYEEVTTDANAGDAETFTLSNDLVDSGATDQSLVLYDGDTLVQPDSIDYAADSFDYTDAGTNTTLGVFYAAGDQAMVEIEKEAPNGTTQTLWSGDLGLLHMRDHGKEPVTLALNGSYWEPFVPTDWNLNIYVNAPYTVRWSKDLGGTGDEEEAINALLGVPVRKSADKIPGLARRTRLDAAER